MDNMTPKQRVFGTLRNLQRLVDETDDLNAIRERLSIALERCITWEGELVDLDAKETESAG